MWVITVELFYAYSIENSVGDSIMRIVSRKVTTPHSKAEVFQIMKNSAAKNLGATVFVLRYLPAGTGRWGSFQWGEPLTFRTVLRKCDWKYMGVFWPILEYWPFLPVYCFWYASSWQSQPVWMQLSFAWRLGFASMSWNLWMVLFVWTVWNIDWRGRWICRWILSQSRLLSPESENDS